MAIAIIDILRSSPLLTLFLLIGAGLFLGNLEIRGISLGSSGVLFAAMLAGHLGCQIPGEAGTIGLILFVYCIGIGAGGRFFGALRRDGSQLARLALIVVCTGALLTWGLSELFHFNPALATGVFAGAMTSTPALAAAIEGSGSSSAEAVVGYGVAYPFGVIAVVLFVQLLPRLLRLKIEESTATEPVPPSVIRQLVEIQNPNLFGKPVGDESIEAIGACQVSRIFRDGRMTPVHYGDTFSEGQLVLLVGDSRSVKVATSMLGKAVEQSYYLDCEEERRVLTVTSSKFTGRSLSELDPLRTYGVVVTRISRMEMLFVPDGSTRLEPHDALTVVGPKANVRNFAKQIGHHPLASSETSLLSLAIGLTLGILVGNIQFPLTGGTSFSLGLAGGPLMVALLLGHFGRVGAIVGHIPRPTRMLLQEMGLVFFLADAGVKGGESLVEAVATNGLAILMMGMVVTVIPLAVGFVIARKMMKMPLAKCMGAICGAMTSTPALGAITSQTRQQGPVVSYATVYPVAVILMAIFAPLLLQLIG